jgi:hypothetical protein
MLKASLAGCQRVGPFTLELRIPSPALATPVRSCDALLAEASP